ncbi:MAG: glycerol-3-phosphate dehydrogenase subunit GlpB [Arcanobacterium sp.]
MKTIVMGAGLAGISAALMLHDAGHRVSIISTGLGGVLLSPGTVDIAGWARTGAPIFDPYAAVDSACSPHPYAVIGVDAVRSGVNWLLEHTELFATPTEHNILVPTGVGAVRPTLTAPKTFHRLEDGQRLLVVGIKQFKDFPAQLIADNLERSPLVNVHARAITIDFPVRENEADSTGTNIARALDTPAGRAQLATALRGQLRAGETVLLPAILGLNPASFADLRAKLDAPVGEVAVPPPSIPGRRLHDELVSQLRKARIDLALNATVVGFTADGERVQTLQVRRAGRITSEKVAAVVYAGGGFESGSLSRAVTGEISERVFGLPVQPAPNIFSSHVGVDCAMRPLDASGKPLYTNLHLAGTVLGGAEPWTEKSGEGIALGSAWAAASAIQSYVSAPSHPAANDHPASDNQPAPSKPASNGHPASNDHPAPSKPAAKGENR